MIIYDLRCDNEHMFEGWFQSAADFDAQISRQLIGCPQCDSQNVRRVPSAVAISGHSLPEAERQPASKAHVTGSMTVMPAGTQIMAAYRQLVSVMVANSEDVGKLFASEARKIHYNEVPGRAIRGDATAEDLESLADEGITVMHLPNFKDEDLN